MDNKHQNVGYLMTFSFNKDYDKISNYTKTEEIPTDIQKLLMEVMGVTISNT